MARIFTMVPFAPDLDLGRANNEAMALLPDDAWACFLDHDTMLTTPHWYRQLQDAIDCRPDAGAFTCVTNRIASPWQRAAEVDQGNNDFAYHCAIGRARIERRTLLDITCTKGFGGVLTLISKAAWREAGGYAHGFYCVDHSIFFRTKERGRRVYMIEGLYIFHRRGSSSLRPALVAPKWEACPCRGKEEEPSERIAL